MGDVAKAKRKRTIIKNLLNKNYFPNVNEILKRECTEELRVEVQSLYESLCEKELAIKDLDVEISDLIEKDDDLAIDMEEADNFALIIKKAKTKFKTFLLKNNEDTISLASTTTKTGVKLPKFVLINFNGDPLEWKSFQETFAAAVGTNENISNVEKFTYLKGYLS